MEIVGDPIDAFGPGAVRHPLRPLIRRAFRRQMRKQCSEAYATAYVTAHSLQQRYPPSEGRFTTNYSNVELEDQHLVDHPRSSFCAGNLARIVMVGTLSQMYKGHDIALQALAHLKSKRINFEMTFIGKGKHQAEMQRLAKTLGVQEQTQFLGELSVGKAVRDQLDRADLFVMPSRTEGLPRAMIEAMARGLPCIGTSIGGIPELLRPEELVPTNRPDVWLKR